MAADKELEVINVKARWQKLDGERTSVLDRAKACAELTIPSLIVDTSHTETTDLDTPYQSLGSRAVNNLASKLLLSLLPPNAPFFRFVPDKVAMVEMSQGDPNIEAQVNQQLADIELALKAQIEREALRVPLFHALKLLVATGNSLVYRDKSGKTKVFNLNNYVVKRSTNGVIQEIITKESISPLDLPQDMQEANQTDIKDVDIYTYVKWNGTAFDVWQEAKDQEVPGTRGTYKRENLPYIALRWTSIQGEDYGRGLVEQYLGDLRSLEALQMSIIEASAASSKILFLVNPASTVKINQLVKAPSGSFVRGNAADITTMQVQKGNDLRIAYEVSQDITRRLASAFLLNESARRDAERVNIQALYKLY